MFPDIDLCCPQLFQYELATFHVYGVCHSGYCSAADLNSSEKSPENSNKSNGYLVTPRYCDAPLEKPLLCL